MGECQDWNHPDCNNLKHHNALDIRPSIEQEIIILIKFSYTK